MGFYLGGGARFGLVAGWMSGFLAGAVGVILAVFLYATRTQAITFISNFYLIAAVVLVIRFALIVRRIAVPTVQGRALIGASGWVAGMLVGTVTYMIPAAVVPYLLGKSGVVGPIESWYRDIFSTILAERLPLAALIALAGVMGSVLVLARRER